MGQKNGSALRESHLHLLVPSARVFTQPSSSQHVDGREKRSKPSRLSSRLTPAPELVSCFHCTPANIFHVNGERRRGEERRGEERGGEGSPNRGYIGKTTCSDGSEEEGIEAVLLSISESA